MSGLLWLSCRVGSAEAAPQERVPWLWFESEGPGCPTAAEFADQISQRGASVHLWSEDTDAGPDLAVVLHAEGRRASGIVRVQDGGSWSSPREVEGASCAEVAGAMALLVALTVSPEEKEPPPSPDGRELGPPEPEPELEPPPLEHPSRQLSLTAGASLRTDVATASAPGVLVGVRSMPTANGSGLNFGSPSWAVGASYARGSVAQGNRSAAHIDLWAAELQVCPFNPGVSRFRISFPCVGAELGLLRGSGAGGAVDTPATDRALWAALAGELQVQARLVQGFWLGVGGGALVPLIRHQMVFRTPDVEIYRVSPLAARLWLGLGFDTAAFP